ncbi:MAG TPA: ribonuclease III [Clostridiaceae bacterium]|nr:ribonuclease III [Clostridiaceae bacterium]
MENNDSRRELEDFHLKHLPIKRDLREIPCSTLAWVGDSVYDLYIRMALVEGRKGCHSGELHRAAISIVSAPAQAQALKKILPLLDEEELSVARRARNHDPGSMPKNVDPALYRQATALEALVGYLYLAHKHNRLTELIQRIIGNHKQTPD